MAANPIDKDIRERLKKLVTASGSTTTARLRQIELAKRIGRSPAWVNKYVNGVGNATVDDAIRILAIVIGIDALRLTADEQRVLRVWRRVPVEKQPDGLFFLRGLGRRPRRATR
jgi:transcriptional regulator with XRE-family HTH domain